jgi:hypothetical protein
MSRRTWLILVGPVDVDATGRVAEGHELFAVTRRDRGARIQVRVPVGEFTSDRALELVATEGLDFHLHATAHEVRRGRMR